MLILKRLAFAAPIIFKKLLFALPFFLSLAWFSLQLNPFLSSPTFLVSLNFSLLIPLILLLASLILTALFFVVFASLAADWRIILPVSLLASLIPLAFLSTFPGLIFSLGLILTFTGVFFLLKGVLASYLTFKAGALLTPAVKQSLTLILIATAVVFYLSANSQIKETGFQLPDQIYDAALSFVPEPEPPKIGDAGLPVASLQQIEALEQNPKLLKRYGLDPNILEMAKQQLEQSEQKTTPKDLLKPALKQQMEKIIAPYEDFVPIILTVLFFITLQSLASLMSIFISPLIWLIFAALDQAGFTKYEVEMREVKKLVV